jgi:SP family arabinose:H+ symporter-like MFS transporter
MAAKTEVRSTAGEGAGKAYSFFISFVAAIGGFLFGYDLSIIAVVGLCITKHFTFNATQLGLLMSVASFGCIAGPTLSAYLCDRFGRKGTLIFSGALFIVGAFGTALPDTISPILAFRFIGGVGVGVASLASPMYIAEVSPAARRGRLGLMYQLAIVVGAIMSNVVAYYIVKYIPNNDLNWRWMFASIIPLVAVFIFLLTRVPQSPRWLAGRGLEGEASAVLTRIDGAKHARAEMQEIRESLKAESGKFAELLQPGIKLALLTGILLALFNNGTGWTGIGFYIPLLLERSGFPRATEIIGAGIAITTIMGLETVLSIWLVDRVGRRPLWITTSAAMCVAMTVGGLAFHLGLKGPWMIVVILFMATPHSIGLGPLPWLMMSELYPTRIRARAVSVSTSFIWLVGFLGPFVFPRVGEISQATIGSPAAIFWIYAFMCVLALLFGIKLLPETKGRTLEEIAASWHRKRGPSQA